MARDYRKILHLDLDAFFCAVEARENPSLHGKVFAVGGQPEERGVVASCSYPARMKGIHSAMPMSQAQSICKSLIIVPPNHEKYSAVSKEVMACLHNISPLVEQISIDEAFIDISDITEDGQTIARILQKQINQDLHLPCSLGVASNKLVAKIANDEGKRLNKSEKPPNAITVVLPGQEAAFLAPLPVIALWGVGPKTAEKLQTLGIKSIGDMTRRSESEMMMLFGKTGRDLLQRAQGIDNSPVADSHEIKSISQEITFSKDQSDVVVLKKVLAELAEGVGWRLRKEGLSGKTVKLKLRWADFTTLSRQTTLSEPFNQDRIITAAAVDLFERIWLANQSNRQKIRLLGIGVSGFENHAHQLGLWDTPSDKGRRLQTALDNVREKFGPGTVHRGSSK